MAGASMNEQQTVTTPMELQPEAVEQLRVRRDGPFWLAIAAAVGGAVFILLGSVTIVPWISDERQRETVRSVWLALSRNLPDIGQPTLEKIGFWVLVALVAALSVALMIAASAVRDDGEQDSGKLA
jgi:hypothetical protein